MPSKSSARVVPFKDTVFQRHIFCKQAWLGEVKTILLGRYAEKARKAILNVENRAIRLKAPHTSPEHILLGLLEGKDTTAVQILEQIRTDILNLKAELESQLMAQAPAQPPAVIRP